MALTIRDYTGDGNRTLYPIDFDLGYLDKEHVYVFLSGDDYKTQLDYNWVNSSQIELTVPVTSGQVFHIRRVTPRNNIFNDYEDGAILKERNLDDSFKQSLMILQEVEDGFFTLDGLIEFKADIDLHNYRLKNVANALTPADASNMGHIMQLVDARFAMFNSDGFDNYGLITESTDATLDDDYGII